MNDPSSADIGQSSVRQIWRSGRVRAIGIGRRRVLIHGFTPSFWTDVYHVAMTAGWSGFLAGLAAIFVLVNAGFACAYWFSPGCVANADGEILKLFFFSVETLTTVGYGEFFPQTTYAHVVVSAETFVGLFYTASMLGLIFARVSRPRARLVFARHLTIGPHDGEQTLVIRVANERLNMIASATARVWLSIQQQTQEEVSFRRFLELKLVRSENPIFTLSWTVLHTIDEASPLHGFRQADLAEMDAFVVIAVAGHDETSAQEVHSRHIYSFDDIRWGHRYVDILKASEPGLSVLDYGRFHDVEPVPGQPDAGAAAQQVSSPRPAAPIASDAIPPGRR